MWIKFALCGLVVAFCVLIGYVAGEKYRTRKKFFTALADFNGRYLAELAYSRKPLAEFLASCNYKGEFRKVAEAVSRREPLPKLPFLTKDETETLDAYVSMLGRGDSYSQSGFFSAQKEALEKSRAQAEREAKTRGELYLKLGFLAGLALIILML